MRTLRPCLFFLAFLAVVPCEARAELVSSSDTAEITAGFFDLVDDETFKKLEIRAPSDGHLYRFVRRDVKFLKEEGAQGRIVDVEYNADTRTLTAKLKVEGCGTGMARILCPDIRVKVRLTAWFEKDAADPAPAIPEGLEKVGEVVNAYQRRIHGLELEIQAEGEKKESVIRDFQARLRDRIQDKKGVEAAELATRSAGLAKVASATEAYQRQVGKLAVDYTSFMRRYAGDYPALVRGINQDLIALAGEASRVPLDGIPEIALRFSALEQRDWQATTDVVAIARELESRFRFVHDQYLSGIEGLRPTMQEEGLEPADSVAEPIQSLVRVREACTSRSQSFSSQIRLIAEALKTREKNLLGARVDARTREDFARAQRLESAARFASEVRESAKSAWAAPRTMPQSDLAYLGEDAARKRDFLMYRDLCSKRGSDWTHTGCLLAAPDFERTDYYLRRTLGRRLAESARRLRAMNRPEILPGVERLESAVASNRWTEGAFELDQILRSMEAQ